MVTAPCGPVTAGPQPPARVDLIIYECDAFTAPLKFYTDNPPTTPMPITGWDFVASFAAEGMDDLTVANGGVVIDDALTGEIHLEIADTCGLPFKNTDWHLHASAGGPGLPSRWVAGKASVVQDF